MSDVNEISIEGLDEDEVIAALHNNTRAIGMGRLPDRGWLTASDVRADGREDREAMFGTSRTRDGMRSYDYFHGRPLKIRIGNGRLEGVRLYDRDAGEGTAARVIAELRAKASK